MQNCSSDYRYACSLWSQKVILRCQTESRVSAECLQGLSKHFLPVTWQVVGIEEPAGWTDPKFSVFLEFRL